MKKKIFIIAAAISLVTILAAPFFGTTQPALASSRLSSTEIFEVYTTGTSGCYIYVDRGSGVCYYLQKDGIYKMALTVMLDRDGTPMTKEKLVNNMNRINGKE